ncbi:hypothetical protein FUA23_14510 [Neolewinella aurantiaca]|uniref:Copper-binding protein MbnP-like domain-containing protein n=1 Tax=Neolewinella aurantiaca TaxID=2602767 RepID=A0A5C7FG08_9BACT|nr:MbnP family protein [Neolewinella aurantiaca]TXF88495.1 hypothetical protein FUA23_14510 [Neolewinella aurantiaca]
MKYLSLIALFALLFFAACQDDDDPVQTGDIATTIQFRAEYDDTDLAIQSATYAYPTGAELKATLFQYYVSDLTLIAADSSEVELSEIELIRYDDATADNIEERTYDVPAGDYIGLRFGLGVKPELNALDPNNFAADDPLNENEFWNSTARYVFAKIEANADLENDGTFDTGLSYHMGSDALYSIVTFTGSFTLDGDNDPQLIVTSDVLKALSDGMDTFDIADPEKQRVHGGNQAVATEIWERLAGQFELLIQ